GQSVIPGRCEASNPESRDSPVRNCAPEVWSFGPSRMTAATFVILHFEAKALVSAAFWRPVRNVHHRPPSLARRTIQRLAVRAGQGDRRAAEEKPKGRGAVRDRLRSVGPAAYRHLWRGRAHHH